jgi:hypothetical protein
MASAPAQRARWQAALACGGALWWWWRTRHPVALLLLAVAAVLFAAACVAPQRYAPVQRGLDRVVEALLAGLSWGVLALVYFGLFLPLRAVRAALGQSWLPRRGHGGTSFFTPLPPHSSGQFDRQF